MNQDSKSKRTPASSGSGPASPKDPLGRDDLGRQEKLENLSQWELDLREGMVAEEDNMPASEPPSVTLDEALDALRSLGAESEFHDVPTKHG